MDAMTDRRELLGRLRAMRVWFEGEKLQNPEGSYIHQRVSNWEDALGAAIACLTARALTKDEFKARAEAGEPVWVEEPEASPPGAWALPFRESHTDGYSRFHMLYALDSYGFRYYEDSYGREWRAWTDRPTEAQRRAEPWDA